MLMLIYKIDNYNLKKEEKNKKIKKNKIKFYWKKNKEINKSTKKTREKDKREKEKKN